MKLSTSRCPRSLSGLAAAVMGTGIYLSAGSSQAQTCVPLNVVGGSSTVVEKTVSPPSTLITQSNWNTDFVVPDEYDFESFIATVTSESGSIYDIHVNLKYNDDTVDQAYSATEDLTVGEPLEISVAPRVNQQPYQVNLHVGGLDAVENVYTASVSGCF